MSKTEQPQQVEMTELSGMPVRSPDGELLGQIENLSVDVREGTIGSARLRLAATPSGRILSIDLPWSLLRLHASGRRLILDISLPTLVAVARDRVRRSSD